MTSSEELTVIVQAAGIPEVQAAILSLQEEVASLRKSEAHLKEERRLMGLRLNESSNTASRLIREVDRLRERIHPASDLSRAVHVSTGFLLWFGTRDDNGNRITAEWGEPDEDGFYEPMFTKHLDTSLQDAERARIRGAVEALDWETCGRIDCPCGRELVDRAAVLHAIGADQ
jgi:hypothetical protein